jgi:tRNA nucleotidyltransferase (CCA-adding enzyme)
MADVITTHINAEFDSFASMVAARRLYPEALLVFPGAQERNLRHFLENFPHQHRFRRLRSIRPEKVTRLILVDTRRIDRIGRLADLVCNPGLEVHIYDHHPASEHDIRGAQEVIAETGANATLFVELFQQKGMRITPAEATIFGLGIYEDTGSLCFTSTTPRDVRAVAHLLECGLDLKVVAAYVQREPTAEQISLLNDLLTSREFVDAGGIRVAVATAARERFVGDLAVVGHKMKDIENLNALFLLVRMNDRIHLVARSRLEAVDVGEIAAALGGGGHPTASSAVIRETDLEQVKARLVAVIRDKVRTIHSARSLMSAAPKALAPGDAIDAAREVMARFSLDYLPVLEEGRLRGVAQRETVERAARHGLGSQRVADFMTTEYETLAPDDSYFRIQDLFLNRGRRWLPVVEEGRLVGAVTSSDLLGVLRTDSAQEPAWRDGPAPGRALRISRNVAGLLAERLPPPVHELAGRLGRVAARLGVHAYLVGGFVRDLLLVVPNLDMDVVVEGDGIAFAREVAGELSGRIRSHTRFETAVVILPDGFKIDVATARMEYYEQPGALPHVEHGSIRMDLYRRDFTINALAVQLDGADHGRLIDFFGGQRDLEEGAVRVLHDLSFVDDPTRIFRAVRFESRLDFSIAESTLRLMSNAVKGHLVETIAGRRLLGELKGILRERKPLAALRRLQELDLLACIHPPLAQAPLDAPLLERLAGIITGGDFAGRPGFREWLVYLAALSRQFTLEELASLTARLALNPEPAGLLLDANVGHRRLAAQLGNSGMTPADVYRAADAHPLETIAFTLACYPGTPIEAHLREYLDLRGRVQPLLTGEDLKAMGLLPGPRFKELLSGLLDAQLNGQVADRPAAEAWVRRRAEEAGA